MSSSPDPTRPSPILETTGGDFRLQDYVLRHEGSEWTVWHVGAVLTWDDEQKVIRQETNRLPYGVALWPSALALAHDVASRGRLWSGSSVLEIGAGAGLPGIVAASFGAQVTQTDRDELALLLCRRNVERNQQVVRQELQDWAAWTLDEQFDWIIGADVLYGESLHPQLAQILTSCLKPGGQALLSDPFRSPSLRFFESLEAQGWRVTFDEWQIGETDDPRPVGVFQLTPPHQAKPTD